MIVCFALNQNKYSVLLSSLFSFNFWFEAPKCFNKKFTNIKCSISIDPTLYFKSLYSTPPPLSIQIGQRTGALELIVYELLIHVLQKPFKDANITVGTYLSTNGKQRNLYIQILYLFTFLTINKWYELVYNK